MPGSVRENDEFVRNFVIKNGLGRVLDVGTGQGTYADILRGAVSVIDGIEVWEPYYNEYNLDNKYNRMWRMDARLALPKIITDRYDLVIFGDILEHMTEEEALTCWSEASRISTWGLISVPIIHYPQGAEGGNPYEVHVQDHLTPEHVREVYGPFDDEAVYNITGTFIKRF